jgi:ribosome-associated protein
MKARPARARKAPAKAAAPTPRKAPDRSQVLAVACARAADDKLAEGTLVIDVRGRTAVCDFIVVTTADSQPHLRAVADAMQEAGEKLGSRLHHREGEPGSPWVLLDFVDVVAHIFDGPSRKFYELERLWADARRIAWKPASPPKKLKK